MRTKIVLTTAGLAVAATTVGAGVLAPAATAATPTATMVYQEANRTITYSPGGMIRPEFAGLDTDGDHQPDVFTYCIEPRQALSSGVVSGSQQMVAYGLDAYSLVDAGKVRWVIANGFPRMAPEVVATQLGIDISSADPQRVARAMQAATQAALYRYTSGYTVSPGFTYDTRTVGEAKIVSAVFTKTYQYLVTHAVSIQGSAVVWDAKKGDPSSQGLIEVPTGEDPTKPTDPTKPLDPTKVY